MLKKLVAIIAFASLTAGVAYAGLAPATGVVGSAHDISYGASTVAGAYTADKYERVCAFCHTPHNALPAGSNPAPLWNHAESTVKLPSYAWASPMNSPIAFASDPLIGPSRLCMACHDGIVAVDSHGSAGSTPTGAHPMAGVATAHYTDGLGNTAKRYIDDLTVTHPIGFLYDDAFTARGATEIVAKTTGFIRYPVTASFDTNARVGALSTKTIENTLYSGYFTCASCHDVHNTLNVASNTGKDYNYFIYAREEGSAICLSCHVK